MSQGLCPSGGQGEALQPEIVSAVASLGHQAGGYFFPLLAEHPFQSQHVSPRAQCMGLQPSSCEQAPLDGAGMSISGVGC